MQYDRYDRKSAVDWPDKLVNHSPLLTRALDKGILVRIDGGTTWPGLVRLSLARIYKNLYAALVSRHF